MFEILGVDEAGYDRAIRITREILTDPDLIRLRDTFARGLAAAPAWTRKPSAS